jgi:NADH-quinone oxidoreductase subunit N
MTPPIPISALVPELILLAGGCIVLLLGQASGRSARQLAPWVTLATLIIALGTGRLQGVDQAALAGSGLYFGSLSTFVRFAALGVVVLIALVNWSQSTESERGEFLSMLLFSTAGLLLVGSADNLVILFLALELVSIPTYIMVVLSRTTPRALEAGTKYFYLGALSAAIMAYGFSFLYGLSGTASLSGTIDAVRAALANGGTLAYGFAVVGLVLSLGGLMFKIAAVPLHFYIADVYHGAASPVAGLLGFVPKIAGFVAIFKIITLTGHWSAVVDGIYWMLWIIALVSMTVGNVLALRQTNIKRLLAYSGIAHAGYMLVGVLAGPNAGKAVSTDGVGFMGDGTAAVLYYVVIYGIANLAAFGVLGLLRVRSGACETLRDVAGLLRREPGLALLLALAMFTLMGLPPTPGFWGKVSLFGSALTASRHTGDTRLVVLVIFAVLNSALAAAYYLRVIAAVLLYDNERPAFALSREAQHIGTLACGFLLIVLAFVPSLLMNPGLMATRELRNPPVPLVEQPPPAETIPEPASALAQRP